MSFADVDGGGGRRGWGGGYQDPRAGGGGRRSDEYEQLSAMISNNIKQINYNVSQITKMVNNMGVPNKDSHDLRVQLRDLIDSTRKMALDTNKIMKDISQLSSGDAQETKKQQTKLKTDFQNCLERFQEISKIAGKKASSSVPPKSTQSQGSSALPGATPWHDDEEEDEHQSLVESQKKATAPAT